MKNITIGMTGPNWVPARSASYYAQRGDAGDYAFGSSCGEALANLEEREAKSNQPRHEDLAEEVAFLALGAAEYLRTERGFKRARLGGYMGVITEVIRCAPLLADRWRQVNEEEYAGVWLYDVTERFGREWAEALLEDTQQCAEDLLESILNDGIDKRA